MTHPLTNSLNLEAQPLVSFQHSPLFASTKPPILLSSLNLPSPSSRCFLSLSTKIFSIPRSGFSTSTASSLDAVHGNGDGFHIVSTTEHEDGSYVFRFGDASEVAKIAESSKPDVSSNDTEESIIDKEVSKTEKEDATAEKEDASYSNEITGSINEVAVERETSNDHQVGVSEGHITDMKLEHDVGTSMETISYEIVTPARTESKDNGELEGENSSDHNSETDLLVVDSGSSTISTEEVSEKESEYKIPSQPAASVSESDTEVVSDFASQEDSNGLSVAEVAHLHSDNEDDNAHSDAKPVPGRTEDKGLEIAMIRESTDNAHSGTEPDLDLSEDNAHSVTIPVPSGSEDKGPETVMVCESTDNAYSETKPVLDGSEDDSHSESKPVLDGSEDDAHSETTPVLGGSVDNDLEIAMDNESTIGLELENILDQEQVHDSLEVYVETKENESEKALEGDAQTAADDAQSCSEDETPNQSASSVFASATEVVNEVMSQEDNNENIVIEAIPLTEDKEESDSGLPAFNTVDSSQTSEATKESVEVLTMGCYLSSGAALLPHPSMALAGAEDAYFIDDNWLGIAEGIGEWSLEETNARKYSRELMKNCGKIVSDNKGSLKLDPVEVLKEAAAATNSPGASTALISHFNGQALHVANIGDSGFIILRNGVICARSSPMLHEFHFPLQIHSGDDPSKLVEVYRIDLEEDDIIITATDGLFDNLYEQEIALIVTKSLQAGLKPQEIAAKLAARAQEVGGRKNTRSPFADAAQAAGYVGCSGGKLDNVTVIVSLLQTRSFFSDYSH